MQSVDKNHTMNGLILDYIAEFKQLNMDLVSISYYHFDLHILVWAILYNYDRIRNDQLFVLENIINSNYTDYGFRLTTIIMQKSDNFLVPAKFQLFKELNTQNQLLKY